MNTKSRLIIYLVLILLAGVGLALAVPALAQAHAFASGDLLASSAADNIIYVDKYNSSGVTNGESWETAYTNLQDALVDAVSSDQIWVARGVYIPGVNRSDTFQLVPGVAVYGGFDPAVGADQFGERDWGAYPTILSGDIGGDDTNTDGVVLTTTHIIGANSYHVVMVDGTSTPITGTTVLDGFTITAGQANANGVFPDDRGGGYNCEGSGSGAECSPNLRDITFSGNSAGYFGGAMYNHGYQGSSSPTLTNVTFSGNSADFGGAMNNNGQAGNSNPILREVTFSGNSAGSHGGAMFNYGYNGTSSPSLSNVTFTGNSAGYRGGAMYNYGYNGTSSPSLSNVTFSGNSAFDFGGAMYNFGYTGASSPSLANVTFSGNSAGNRGGAMYNYGHDGDSSPSLSNVTFAGNSAYRIGGAMFNYGYNGTSSPSLSNVILWGNTAESFGSQIYNTYASVTITTSLVQGGIIGGIDGDGTVTDGGGNLDDDPDFERDPDPGPDGDWDGVDDDYGDLHLWVGSPAIDSGTNSAISLPTDLDGNPRVVDGDLDGTATVDMGAYELQTYDAGFVYLPIIIR